MLTIDRSIPSPHRSPGWLAPPRLLVLHSTENPCTIGIARAVARYFAAPATQASAHFVVGPDAIFECVDPAAARAWHVGAPANAFTVGVEQTGRAAFSVEEWAAPEAEAMLSNVVDLLAVLCTRFSLPARCVGVEGLRAGDAGITTHGMIARAFGGTSHWDPGPHYPLDAVVGRVVAALEGSE